MRLPRVRFTVRRMMGLVAAAALLLAAQRVVVLGFPHVRRCWQLAAKEERISRSKASPNPSLVLAVFRGGG
jgi:ATP-dependent RNA circularization protein (DNA/RNA ligase family)